MLRTPGLTRRGRLAGRCRLMAALLVFWAAVSLHAQTGRGAAPAARPDGVHRTAEGKPDFTGVWQAMTSASANIQDHVAEHSVRAGRGIVEGNEIPYRPEALLKKQENFRNRLTADPVSKCYLPGVPRAMYMPYAFQIAQGPDQIVMLFEYVHGVRNVFMKGEHYPGHIDFWMGDSRGHWDGDTLVVDVIHFNDQTWLDTAGNFHSDELHVVERYSPMGPDHIRYEATIEDPKVFTRPWKIGLVLYRQKEEHAQLLEYDCFLFTEAR
jgi:hypothetical protein